MKQFIIVLAAAIAATLCSPSTKITASWKNPKLQAKYYSNIFIASMTSNNIARTTIENELAERLGEAGVKATKSQESFPPTFNQGMPDRETLMGAVRGSATDAILTVTVLRKESETRYVPGSYRYEPWPRYGYYGNFWGYYSYWYPYTYEPGYYTEDRIYFLETNLYDGATEELVWSAQSETYNPSSVTDFSKNFAKTITERMRKDGLLKTAPISARD